MSQHKKLKKLLKSESVTLSEKHLKSSKELNTSTFTFRDFRNPYMLKERSTFGSSPDKINKKAFEREFKTEFYGIDAPPVTTY